jgi:hypothetical protein
MQSPFSDQSAFGNKSSDARFAHTQYIIKRKALQAFGATLYLYGPNEQLVLWGARKAFKLKEDLRFYTDDTKTEEVLRIAARSIMDFSAAYDVFDSRTNQKIGAFKRQGLKSQFVQDTWIIMDAGDREIGQVQEDSLLLGMLRRYVEYVSLVLPQKYTATMGPLPVATYARHMNPFSSRLDIDFSPDQNGALDRRLGLALAMLLESIESKN